MSIYIEVELTPASGFD